MPSVNTGTYSRLRLEASVVGTDVDAIWYDVAWALYFEEISGPGATYNTGGIAANVQITSLGTVWSGTFGFDWRPAGLQSVLLASSTSRVYGNPDGTPPAAFKLTGVIGNTLTSGGGSGATINYSLPLSTLRALPGTPTALAATRISDSSIDLAWAQSSPTNGQPTSNTIRRRINGGAWSDVITISPATSATLTAAANQKLEYGVKASNSAGDSSWSATSLPLFTTPAPPTGLAATKVGADIALAWTGHVAYMEHEHVLEHGVDVAGVITWDASPLDTIAAGTSTYLHASPNPAQRHVYRIRARNTDAAALSSATVQSNVVQLLAAPAKPTVAAPAAFSDKAATFRLAWVHNPIDSSAQTKSQVRYSTNGGSSWTTSSKTTSTDQFWDFAASTWAAGVTVTFQVRTKGAYDSGSDGDASYSPWSDSVSTTFKTRPTASISSPATGGTVTQAALLVVLGFAQPEGATFVSATISLYQGAALLEQRASTALAGTAFATRLLDGTSYTVKATVLDSNGLTSAEASSAFSVDYTEPVAAVPAITYLPDSGIAQIALTIPAAGGGLVDAVSVDVDRIIGAATENVVELYPAAPTLTFLDIPPTIHGTNLYRITTRSADGATSVVEVPLVTAENEWAFMSKGSEVVRFQLAPGLQVTPAVDAALIKMSGRSRPLALYSTGGSVVISGSGALAEGYGSTPEELEDFLLLPGDAWYRDPTGRRIHGAIAGSITRDNADTGQFAFTVTETS